MSNASTLKNHLFEHRLFSKRMLIACFIITSISIGLIARMYHLQIVDYDIHTTQSEKNRIRLEPIPPIRGLIYDTNGILLAQNKPSHSLALIKEKVVDLEESLKKIQSIIEIDDKSLKRFKLKYAKRHRPFEPIPVKLNLTETEIARLAVNQHKIPGLVISAALIRHYPKGASLAHALGYVGRINEREEARIDALEYAGTNHIGKTGLEFYYESQLHGQVGHRQVEVNARGRVLKVLDQNKPIAGKDLHLYLDLATQEAAIKALTDNRGSVVAIDPSTGGIIAFVSQPAFDPNLFVEGIDEKSYRALSQSASRPLYNRALKGQYPPGSTIKPLVALAGLESKAITWSREIWDPGFFKLENDSHRYRDWKRQGHGKVNMKRAIVESCDTYFYQISQTMGIDSLAKQLEPFNLGRKTRIDLPGEKPGLLPTKSWKRKRYGQPWYPGETLIAGIGQGFMLTTPLQLAVSTAILANKGKPLTPRLVKYLDSSGIETANSIENLNKNTDEKTPEAKKEVPIRARHQLSDEQYWNQIFAAMEAVVHSPRGTARGISKDLNYKIAGKTGTAQVIAIKQNEEYDEDKIDKLHRDHALFIAYAPVDDPKIAISVIVENGGGGGSTAAPIARIVLDAYLNPRLSNEN